MTSRVLHSVLYLKSNAKLEGFLRKKVDIEVLKQKARKSMWYVESDIACNNISLDILMLHIWSPIALKSENKRMSRERRRRDLGY